MIQIKYQLRQYPATPLVRGNMLLFHDPKPAPCCSIIEARASRSSFSIG